MAWQYTTIEAVKRAYGLSGYWFSPDSMRFFRTRLSGDAYHNPTTNEYLFISSEQFVPSRGQHDPRRYTIRRMYRRPVDEGGKYDVETIGEFQQYASLNGAKSALKRYMGANND